MNDTVVDTVYTEFTEVLHCLPSAEISLRSSVQHHFARVILLSAASYFEKRVTQQVAEAVDAYSKNNELVHEFVMNKAISRQYHTFFNWKDTNANQFFGLFGSGFKEYMKEFCKRVPGYSDSIRAFLEVGNERNRLVHENFAAFSLEKNGEELYDLYKKARPFVENFRERFEGYLSRGAV